MSDRQHVSYNLVYSICWYRFWKFAISPYRVRIPLSYFLRISLENIAKVKRMDMGSGRKRKKRERERELSIDTSALPSPFYAVLFLELFICGKLHRLRK